MDDRKKQWAHEIGSIIICCVLVLLSLWGYDSWQSYRRTRLATVPPKPLVQVGGLVTLQGVDFAHSAVNLVLVTSPACPYCRASENFHAKVLQTARNSGIPFYVAVPSREKASTYLRSLTVNNEAVREYQQMNISVHGTPTILGIDNSGHLRAAWTGLATPADESEIIDLLRTGSFSAIKESSGLVVPNFQPQELAGLQTRTKLDVIDVREREMAVRASNVVNIPLQELPYRAKYELDNSKLQVVDCSNILWDACRVAVDTLKRFQFNTATLGAGTYHARCEFTLASRT